MKRTLTGLLLLLTSIVCAAEEAQPTRYVTDNFRADLRAIPSDGARYVTFLNAGTQLTVLETNDEGWSRIRTSRGTEGWLLSKYLVDNQVAKVRIVGVQKDLEQAKSDNSRLKNTIAEKDRELEQLREQLKQLGQKSDSTSQELTELKKISGNTIALNEQNQKLLKDNSQLESDKEALAAINDQLKNDQRFSWFMYGAIAVCLGALLTMLIPMLKRKRRYSEWG